MAAAAAMERKRKRMRKRKGGVSLPELPMERKRKRMRKRKGGVSLPELPMERKRKRMRKRPQLPEDIFINILSRLPAKSLCRFRCVSKNMRALVSNSRFMKLHYDQSTKTSPKLILNSVKRLLYTKSVFQVQDHDDPLTMLNCRSLYNAKIVGACNGLVCLLFQSIRRPFYNFYFYLLNPSTGQCNKLPKYYSVLWHVDVDLEKDLYVGFGYDVINNDYKVISMIKGDPSEESTHVFSTRTQIWRNIKKKHYVSNSVGTPSVLLNGILHWPTGEIHHPRLTNLSVLSFDLSHEKFNEVSGPPDYDCSATTCRNLVVLRGCLCVGMTIEKSYEEFMLWMMKDYGVKESWTILIRITIPEMCVGLFPICSMEKGQILFFLKNKYLAMYNPENTTDSFDKIRIPNLKDTFRQVWMYVDSLIPPNGLSDDGQEEAMPICLG